MRRFIGFAIVVGAAVALLGTATAGLAAKPSSVDVCKKGGYLDLFAQDGTGTAASPAATFATQGGCMKWIRAGGDVGTLRPELVSDSGVVHFWLTVSGAAPVGTVRVCESLPLLVAYDGSRGSGCLDPPLYGTPFQVLYGPCEVGSTTTVGVTLAKADGGVVRRSVSNVCG